MIAFGRRFLSFPSMQRDLERDSLRSPSDPAPRYGAPSARLRRRLRAPGAEPPERLGGSGPRGGSSERSETTRVVRSACSLRVPLPHHLHSRHRSSPHHPLSSALWISEREETRERTPCAASSSLLLTMPESQPSCDCLNFGPKHELSFHSAIRVYLELCSTAVCTFMLLPEVFEHTTASYLHPGPGAQVWSTRGVTVACPSGLR